MPVAVPVQTTTLHPSRGETLDIVLYHVNVITHPKFCVDANFKFFMIGTFVLLGCRVSESTAPKVPCLA